MWKKTNIYLVLCLLALSLITSCQPTESIAVDDIIGVWVMDPSGSHVFYKEDGSFIFSSPNNFEDPSAFGTYQLVGTTMSVQHDDESPLCAGDNASLQVELIDSNKLVFTKIEGDCPDRQEVETYYRITP